MALRASTGKAFYLAAALAPPLGIGMMLARTNNGFTLNGEVIVVALSLLIAAFAITFLGLLIFGLPLTAVIDRLCGSLGVAIVNGGIGVIALAGALLARDPLIGALPFTLAAAAGIFTFFYLRALPDQTSRSSSSGE